jgi:DNA-binding Lrp family transcriptional regulator
MNRRMVRSMLGLLQIDAIDQQIVAALVENARLSHREVGERVGLSAAAVNRRISRLRRDGVIRGFTAVIDPLAPGHPTEAFVELWCRNHVSPRQIAGMLAEMPQVVAAYTVSGDADALVHLRTADTAQLELVIEQIRGHPNADRTKTVLVLSRLLPQDWSPAGGASPA